MKYTREKIKEVLDNKGYKYFENGDYNLNIVGIRNSATGTKVTNKFDDTITVSGCTMSITVLQTQVIIGWKTQCWKRDVLF